MKNIGVLTSGGDSPGMNACIRAVVRTALYYKYEVFGIQNGLQGLIDNSIQQLYYDDVSNIIQRGGTILGSARSKEFRTYEGRERAHQNLKTHDIDALVVIGGDGSFTGASILAEEFGVKIIGCPGTIDNDLYGTDYTIGFDTALNTVVEAVDKIRDTASAHHRLFFVEVMGRDAGFIALQSGIAVGAEDILIPEVNTDIQALIDKLKTSKQKIKSSIVIVAEGDDAGGAFEIASKVGEELPDYDTRVSVLGHIQRGGNPTAYDRLLATRMGCEAVEQLKEGISGVMIATQNNQMKTVPLDQAIKGEVEPNTSHLRLLNMLSAY